MTKHETRPIRHFVILWSFVIGLVIFRERESTPGKPDVFAPDIEQAVR